MTPILERPGRRVLLMGNEAIARGAIEAGLEVAAAYPGTPSSEVVEALYAARDQLGLYVEWSTNEKVAFEVAAGASLVGARSLVAMKNAGLNVAMDTFMTIPYGGVRGGLLVVVADDPNAHYSSTEQDSRVLARYAEIPCLEPADQQQAAEMAGAALEISEQLELPVVLRSVTRISHASGDVQLSEVTPPGRRLGFNKHWRLPYRWNVYGAPGAVHKHEWLHSTFEAQKQASESSPFNVLELVPGAKVGVIGSGIGVSYARDAISELGVADRVSFLGIGFVNPPPTSKIADILSACETVVVVEEGDPVVESYVAELARTVNPAVRICGKVYAKLLPATGEINIDIAACALAKALELEPPHRGNADPAARAAELLVPRSSTLCAGCPHLGSYWAIRQVLRKIPGVHIVNGDIGCYEQGGYGIFSKQVQTSDEISAKFPVRSAYEILDTIYVMGSGIGLAQGQLAAGYKDGKVLAVAGDSTFFHACLPAVANAAVNSADICFVVLDNSWTAMTGHQPSPRTGKDQTGREMPKLDIPAVAGALGIEDVRTASAFDVAEAAAAVSEALETEGPSVVVLTGECALQVSRRLRRHSSNTKVDAELCAGCKICLELGCPAVTFDNASRKAAIDSALCVDCGLCAQICPSKAISCEVSKDGS